MSQAHKRMECRVPMMLPQGVATGNARKTRGYVALTLCDALLTTQSGGIWLSGLTQETLDPCAPTSLAAQGSRSKEAHMVTHPPYV